MSGGVDNNLISKKLIEGQSLAIYLEPDDKLFEERKTKEYSETYDLPNILMEDELFFAFSEANHISGDPSDPLDSISAYSYSNFSNFFTNFACKSRLDGLNKAPVKTRIMSRSRYKTFKFITKNNYKLLWDSHHPTKPDEIIRHLKQGLKFKIALLDEKNIWHFHLVDLPFFWPESNLLQMQTHVSVYPAFFEQPFLFNTQIIPKHPIVFSVDTDRPDANIELEALAACSYISAYSDGTYRRIDDLKKRDAPLNYKQMKVFCEKLP